MQASHPEVCSTANARGRRAGGGSDGPINAWEGRWPLNTYRDRDASKLSRSALDRLAMAEAMTLADYGSAIAVRQRNRVTHSRLKAHYDAAITLSAPGAAPVGLGSTGNPVFNVPASMLGIPAVSLPLLSIVGCR